MIVLREKQYGLKSKVLGLISPGAWFGKEAAKYGYTNYEDYKKHRWGYAVKGFFTPATALVIKKTVEKMADSGCTPDQIRKYLENDDLFRIAGGVLEVVATKKDKTEKLEKRKKTIGYIVGIHDKLRHNRAAWVNSEEYEEEFDKLERRRQRRLDRTEDEEKRDSINARFDKKEEKLKTKYKQ